MFCFVSTVSSKTKALCYSSEIREARSSWQGWVRRISPSWEEEEGGGHPTVATQTLYVLTRALTYMLLPCILTLTYILLPAYTVRYTEVSLREGRAVSCLTLLCSTASHWGRRGRHWSASSIFPCQPVRQCETMLKYKTECLGRDASYKLVQCTKYVAVPRLSVDRMLRWSIQRANGQYRDHLVGQITS